MGIIERVGVVLGRKKREAEDTKRAAAYQFSKKHPDISFVTGAGYNPRNRREAARLTKRYNHAAAQGAAARQKVVGAAKWGFGVAKSGATSAARTYVNVSRGIAKKADKGKEKPRYAPRQETVRKAYMRSYSREYMRNVRQRAKERAMRAAGVQPEQEYQEAPVQQPQGRLAQGWTGAGDWTSPWSGAGGGAAQNLPQRKRKQGFDSNIGWRAGY